MDLISVIIPVYKTEAYLRRCIDSVLGQTWTNLQIIAVDDGSPDNSGVILDEYQKKDPRITVIHQENKGVSTARNAGLAMATGDYIGFVDSDDALAPNMYEVLVNLAKEYDAPISHCGYRRISKDGSTKEISGTGMLMVQNNQEAMDCLLSGRHFVGSLWNKLFDRRLLDGLSFREDLKINEDFLMAYQLFKKSERSVYIDRSLYLMFEREGSATSSGTKQDKREKDLLFVAEWIAKDSANTNFETAAQMRYIEILAIEYAWLLSSGRDGELLNIRKKLAETNWEKYDFRLTFKIKLMMLLYAPILYGLTNKVYRKIFKSNWDTV
ncbi:glycosyltransferase [Pseudoflavonifractor phocaeensis]|uniref:glycosyltransferase n=1 Tax=Pseudoflavonifractor phocaeensis TaxID=1870988 RepID=UPI0019566451|nr:glycosyltransferase [Pseudoflavonifractor phocaeensis]MBM6937450.1 glycosyltransferase [Pseudoflavonifractor phocaeensis]